MGESFGANILGVFPFGAPVREVQQRDRSIKPVFVLGVYASAVHAIWQAPNGADRVAALAVASEPYIFWRGDGSSEIVAQVRIPSAAGTLLAAPAKFNGPSGRVLDTDFLEPLGLTREDTWLCDLVPHSCLNSRQLAAIGRQYQPIESRLHLPPVTAPRVPRVLCTHDRRKAILAEIRESRAEMLVLLGDQPIRWFLSSIDSSRTRLAEFGDDNFSYGRLHNAIIEGRRIRVLPLVHPRQAGRLGRHSETWAELHRYWREKAAPEIGASLRAGSPTRR